MTGFFNYRSDPEYDPEYGLFESYFRSSCAPRKR